MHPFIIFSFPNALCLICFSTFSSAWGNPNTPLFIAKQKLILFNVFSLLFFAFFSRSCWFHLQFLSFNRWGLTSSHFYLSTFLLVFFAILMGPCLTTFHFGLYTSSPLKQSLLFYVRFLILCVFLPLSGGDTSSSTTGSASPVPNSYDSLEGGNYPGMFQW